MEKNKPEILVCECSSSDHIVVIYPDEDEGKVAYLHVHLVPRPFLSRVFGYIPYIFGKKTSYGGFDEIVLGPQHAEELQELVNYLKS